MLEPPAAKRHENYMYAASAPATMLWGPSGHRCAGSHAARHVTNKPPSTARLTSFQISCALSAGRVGVQWEGGHRPKLFWRRYRRGTPPSDASLPWVTARQIGRALSTTNVDGVSMVKALLAPPRSSVGRRRAVCLYSFLSGLGVLLAPLHAITSCDVLSGALS